MSSSRSVSNESQSSPNSGWRSYQTGSDRPRGTACVTLLRHDKQTLSGDADWTVDDVGGNGEGIESTTYSSCNMESLVMSDERQKPLWGETMSVRLLVRSNGLAMTACVSHPLPRFDIITITPSFRLCFAPSMNNELDTSSQTSKWNHIDRVCMSSPDSVLNYLVICWSIGPLGEQRN